MPLPLIQWLKETKKVKTDELLLEFCMQAVPGKAAADLQKIRDHLRTELDKVLAQVLDLKGIKGKGPASLVIPSLKQWKGERRWLMTCEEMEEQLSDWPLLDQLQRHRGYSDLLSEKSEDSEKNLRKALDLGVPLPRSQMKLDLKCAESFKKWFFAPEEDQLGDQALFIGIIQIGGRTNLSKDLLFLSRLVTVGPVADKNHFELALKPDVKPSPPKKGEEKEKNAQTALAKADEQVSAHFRFLKKLVKNKVVDIADWNDGIDPAFLTANKLWNRAGCFYGFYLLVDRRGGSRFDFVSAALNWYANGSFGNYVPKLGAETLVNESQRMAWTSYAREVKEMNLERRELVQTLREVPGGYHRFFLGNNWRGPKSIPYDYAFQVLRTLTEFSSSLAKKK